MRHRHIRQFLVAITTMLLTACGGGGGTSNKPVTSAEKNAPVVSTETFQIRNAWNNYVQHSGSRSFQLSAIVSGTSVTGSGTITENTLVAASFGGVSARQKTSTLNATMNNGVMTVPLTASDMTYFDATLNLLGYSNDDEYGVVTSFSMPQTARVNDNGVFYVANRYADSSRQTLLGTETGSFSLEPDTASTALLKMTLVEKDAGGNTTATDTITLRMTASGDLTYLSEKIVFTDGDTLTVTF